MLLLGGAIVHTDANELRVERGELAGAATEIGRLQRSARRIGPREEEDRQILLAAEGAEIERASVVLWAGEGWEGIAYLNCHRLTSRLTAIWPPLNAARDRPALPRQYSAARPACGYQGGG